MRRLILALILLATPATAQTEYQCFSDGFEVDDEAWNYAYSHEGYSITRTNVGSEVYAGSWALKFITPAEDVHRRASALLQRIPWHRDRPLYSEFWFKVEAGTDDFGVEMALEGFGAGAGTDESHIASVVYQQDDNFGILGWRYWDDGEVFQYFDEDAEVTRDVWHHFKWAAHYGDEEYVYAEIDGVPFDLSNLAYTKKVSYLGYPWLGLSILIWSSDEEVAVEVYVDEVKWGTVGTPCGSAGAM